MRTTYRQELATISDRLVEMTRMVGTAMTWATTALVDADLSTAESVIEADRNIDDFQHDLEQRAVDLLALQQPVATDLRIVVTSLQMSADLERAGDLARHVAEVARRRCPEPAVPADLRATVLQMGQVAQYVMAKAGTALETKDVHMALELESDDAMDELLRQLFTHLLDERWHHRVETSVDVTLCGRYYERFADHAVAVAKRLVYLVTGEYADTPV
ncbi:phosphate signaling complex protein PhoU [Streptomyces sp. NPDC058000]|uniref:phosphate signaling complex protein PhoU n=1 Tax=Streptomyces sp. NPDC058000 TaxID=3346299 RepID=UPI0036F1518C